MAYKSEQERLADLIGGKEEGFDQVQNGADMIWEGLKGKIQVDPNKVREIESEIDNHGDTIERESSYVPSSTSNRSSKRVKLPEDVSVENVLMELYSIHESLIDTFESLDFNSSLANTTIENINRLGNTIKTIGGVVEEFDPIDHVSGLANPDIFENIDKVIETTKRCYKAGSILEINLLEEGNDFGILVVFEGYDKGAQIQYKVEGEVFSENWEGNEALDYIYTPNGGKLSVKKYERGRWIDKSLEDSYQISWDLEETLGGQPKNSFFNNEESSEKEEKEKEEEEEEKEKVLEDEISNKIINNKGNEDDDLEQDINDDFPILEN